MTERHERLRAARKPYYPSAAAAARAMGIPYGTYSGHENGSRDLDPDTAAIYARKYKVNYDWLLYEIGPREINGKVDDPLADLSPDERKQAIAFIEGLKAARVRRTG